MAITLKIIMASAPKKGTQTYISFLSKIPANKPSPGFQLGNSRVVPVEVQAAFMPKKVGQMRVKNA
jgi:hypothetical protein